MNSASKGDIILMCSDGLSNMIEGMKNFAIVKRGQRDIVEAGQNLIDPGEYENRGNDNISYLFLQNRFLLR